MNNLSIEKHIKYNDNLFIIFFNKTDSVSEETHHKWITVKNHLLKNNKIVINVALYMGELSYRLENMLKVYKYPKIKFFSKIKGSKSYNGGKAINHIISWVNREFRKPSLNSNYIADYDNLLDTLENNNKSIILWTKNQEIAAFEFFQKYAVNSQYNCYHMDNLVLLKILFLKLEHNYSKIKIYNEYLKNQKELDEEELKNFEEFRKKYENEYFTFIHLSSFEKEYYDLILCKEKLKNCNLNNDKMVYRNLNKLFEDSLDKPIKEPVVLYNYKLYNMDNKNVTIDYDYLNNEIIDLRKINKNFKFVIFDSKYDNHHELIKRYPFEEYGKIMLMDLKNKGIAKFYDYDKKEHENFNKFYSLFYNGKLKEYEKSEEEIINDDNAKIFQAVRSNFYNIINENKKTLVLYYSNKENSKYKELNKLLHEIDNKDIKIIEINVDKNEVLGNMQNNLPFLKYFKKNVDNYEMKTLFYGNILEKIQYLIED